MRVIATVLACVALPTAAMAQRIERVGIEPASASSEFVGRGPVDSTSHSSRSPVVAVGLSLVFPGLGNAYAGNGGHAARHVEIAAASFAGLLVGVIWGLIDVVGPHDPYGEQSTGSKILISVSGMAYVANWAWSEVTSYQDAAATSRQ